VPSNEDPYPIIESIQKMVAEETEANARAAEEEWKRATGSHSRAVGFGYAGDQPAADHIGVEVHVRYITRAHERYAMRTRLYQSLVALLRRKPIEEGNRQGLMTEKAGVPPGLGSCYAPPHHSRGELSATLSAPSGAESGRTHILSMLATG